MAIGKRQSIKKQFSSYLRVFHHLMSSSQSECSNPLIFYEQKTTYLGILTSETWGSFASHAKCPERLLRWMLSHGSTWKLKLSKYWKNQALEQIMGIYTCIVKWLITNRRKYQSQLVLMLSAVDVSWGQGPYLVHLCTCSVQRSPCIL